MPDKIAYQIPKKFILPIKKVKKLADHKIYLAAFIFGSAARGDLDYKSDLDVIVITDDKNGSKHVLHPLINGIKLDISFSSFNQFVENMEEQIQRGEIIPMVCESLILFDKTGRLTKYKKLLEKTKPPLLNDYEIKKHVFMPLHSDTKIKKLIKPDPTSSLLIMHGAVGDLLKRHYSLNSKWAFSDKRLLPNLKSWDKMLADLVEKYVHENNISQKYRLWHKMLNHVIKPFGKSFEETNCDCKICQKNLSYLAGRTMSAKLN